MSDSDAESLRRFAILEDKLLELGRNQEEIGRQVVRLGPQNDRILEHLADIGAAAYQHANRMGAVEMRLGCIEDRLAEGSSRFSEVMGRISRLERESRNGLTKRRLLLVEDDEPLARVTARCLEDCGAHVTIVGTYAATIDIVRHVRPAFEAAIVDALLPDGSGVELAKLIRARGVLVVLTSGDPSELHGAAERDLVDSVWHKPVRIEDMRADLIRLFTSSDRLADTEPPPAEPTWSGPLDGPPTMPDAGRRRSSAPDTPEPSTADESPEAKKRGE
ncbi:MAG TPA: response regulator [Jiangellaceae bacterium]|nr:response regulator [Jiangellaceae bacterium]